MPAPFVVSEIFCPSAPVITTDTPETPSQFSSSFEAFMTVPATANLGPSPDEWQSMQLPPGCMSGEPWSPSDHVCPEEQLAGAALSAPEPQAASRAIIGTNTAKNDRGRLVIVGRPFISPSQRVLPGWRKPFGGPIAFSASRAHAAAYRRGMFARSRAAALALGTVIAGCSSAPALLPIAHAPSPPPAPVAPPPWEARASVADGWDAPAPATKPVVIRGATLWLGTGKALARGSILLEGGVIRAVAEGDVDAPSGAEVIDGAGKIVTPGIIDTHSHLGVFPMPGADAHEDGNEMTDPVTAGAVAADAFWPEDPGIQRAAEGGVTTIQVLPGSGNLIGGRAITVKLRPGPSARRMHARGAPDGLKMACGENPKRVYGKDKRAPMTRMGNLALQRAAFLRAKKLEREWARYREAEATRLAEAAKKRATYEDEKADRARRDAWCREHGEHEPCAAWRAKWRDKPLAEPEPGEPRTPPDRDPGAETLVAAMQGRVLVHVHCYRADDMLAMLALADEVGFQVKSFHHALEAYKIRDELVRRGVAVSTWADWWGFKMEAYDGIPENAGLVAASGGRAIIHSDSPEGIQRLNQEAGKALASARRAGLAVSDEEAIRWITANPAWALGIDGATGTLEVGKAADVVVWDRSPFSVYAKAERVFVEGAPVVPAREPWSDFELGHDRGEPAAPALVPGGAR